MTATATLSRRETEVLARLLALLAEGVEFDAAVWSASEHGREMDTARLVELFQTRTRSEEAVPHNGAEGTGTADTSPEDYALEYLSMARRALVETEGAHGQRAQAVEAAIQALIDEDDSERAADKAMLSEALALLGDIKAGLSSTGDTAARFLALTLDLAELDLKTAMERAKA